MSVRVAYVLRCKRGGLLRGLRLVGATGEAHWPERDASVASDAADFRTAAAWMRTNLEGPRSRDSLELLVLDGDGATCSWMSCTSTDLDVVGAEARTRGDDDESGGGSTGPVEFFAPSPIDSSVQPLGVEIKHATKRASWRSRGAKQPIAAQRLAVLATSDVPARLLLDELDAAKVRVGGVATIWHAMAMAWGTSGNAPGTPVSKSETPRESVTTGGDSLLGVVMIDPAGRLLWCWSREGELVASGSMRVRVARMANAGGGDDDATSVLCDAGDVGRLVSEWMSWSMQLSRGPSRVLCVMPKDMGDAERVEGSEARAFLAPGEFCESFAQRWSMASVDAVVHEDPIGATLRRLVGTLEATPATQGIDAAHTLVSLSQRPNSQVRRFYFWAAGALALASACAIVLGLRWRSETLGSRERNLAWESSWQQPAKDVFPQALDATVQRGLKPLAKLEDEVGRREKALERPTVVSTVRPVMTEMEAISLVLSAPNVKVESIVIDSGNVPRIVAVMPSTRDAEQVLEALKRVAGGTLSDWTMSIQPVANGDERRATFECRWPDAKKAGDK